jgi:hypothetical protein
MIWLLCLVLTVLTSPFKPRLRLEAENAVLRRQLIVLRGGCRVNRCDDLDPPLRHLTIPMNTHITHTLTNPGGRYR